MQVVIRNFARNISKTKAREKLTKIVGNLEGLTKIEKPYNDKEIYLIFDSQEDEKKALEKLKTFKAEKWSVDLIEQFKKRERHGKDNKDKKKTRIEEHKEITEVVTPLAHLGYAEQLKKKEQILWKLLRERLINELKKEYAKDPRFMLRLPDYLHNDTDLSKLPLDWRGIVGSPMVDGYRNNCEFTCGYDKDNNPNVGFLEGSFISGKTSVSPVSECKHISNLSKTVCNLMRKLIQDTAAEYSCYNKVDQKGFWRQIKVRENVNGECLVAIQVNSKFGSGVVGDNELTAELRDAILSHFPEDIGSNMRIKGICVQFYSGVSNSAPDDSPVVNIRGENTIFETLSGLQFRVSPYSFFQVNTKGAEVLFGIVRDWTLEGSEGKKPILLDICCGTGTIGILMSSKFEQVIGIDISESAIKDAIDNCDLNKVTNTHYICGKAEDTLAKCLRELKLNDPDKHVVAVVDPPRSGLHASVVRAILRCPAIDRLVYVSCNPNSMVDNAINLCKPTSKRVGHNAKPFTPVRAVCVDMFPHTDHCEMVVLFQREKPTALEVSEAIAEKDNDKEAEQ